MFSLAARGFSSYDSCNVANYYVLKNKAELAIIDGNLQQAADFYKQAFQYKFANAKDLKNAFSVAYQLRDSMLAREYSNILAREGIATKYTWIALDSANNPSMFNYVVQDEDSLYKSNVYKYQLHAHLFFDSLDKIDNYLRTHDVSLDSANIADSMVVTATIDFIKTNGYPVLDVNNPNAVPYNTLVFLYFIIWHARDKESFPVLDSLLSQELLEGDLEPDEWIAFMLYRKGYHEKYGNAVWRLNWSELTPRQIAKINNNRKDLNLESLEDYKKKYDYEQQLQRQYGCGRYDHTYRFLNQFLVPPEGAIEAGY